MLSCLSGCLLLVDGAVAVLFFLLFSWLELTTLAVVGACVIAIPIWIWLIGKFVRKEQPSPPCLFQDGISQDEFEQMAHRIAKRIKRLRVSVVGPIVYGEVESQSGISTWNFEVDFNDFGHLTGRWWITERENSDSAIPERFADLLGQAIKERLHQEDDV